MPQLRSQNLHNHSSHLTQISLTEQISSYTARYVVSHSRGYFLCSAGSCQPHSPQYTFGSKSVHLESYDREWKAPVQCQQQYLRDARSEPEVGLRHSRAKYVDGELIARLLSHSVICFSIVVLVLWITLVPRNGAPHTLVCLVALDSYKHTFSFI